MIDDQKTFFNTEIGLPIQIPYKIISMHEKNPINSLLKLVNFTTEDQNW